MLNVPLPADFEAVHHNPTCFHLISGPRDETGKFRIAKGMSSLNKPTEQTRGVQLLDPSKAISLNKARRRCKLTHRLDDPAC